VANWLKEHKDLFDKNAKIILNACGTANPDPKNKGNRVADAFKEALPDSEVWGYTGLSFGVGSYTFGVWDNVIFGGLPSSKIATVPFRSFWVQVK
jgi:hypothetical protein